MSKNNKTDKKLSFKTFNDLLVFILLIDIKNQKLLKNLWDTLVHQQQRVLLASSMIIFHFIKKIIV